MIVFGVNGAFLVPPGAGLRVRRPSGHLRGRPARRYRDAVLIPIWLLVAVGLSLIALHWVLTRRHAHDPPTPHRARSPGVPSIVRSVGSGSLAAVALVGSSGCAEGLTAAGRCAPSTISTVISAIASSGKVPPERVLDAGACWLERAEGQPVDPAPVDELRSAVEAHDAEQAAVALTTCHQAAPSVVGEPSP